MKKLAIIFPGQGSQFIGMSKPAFDEHASVRALFERASSLLQIDFQQLCFEGKGAALNNTENTQPAILLCSVAAYQVFHQQTGLTPRWMAGHSLGELSALVCAEALSFDEGIQLARARGLAMANCTRDAAMGMSAITKLDRAQVEAHCRSIPGYGVDFVIANYNSPKQQVLSGRLEALELAGKALKAAGASVIPLRVSGPFHSPFMQPAAEQLRAQLALTTLRAPKIPVISNVDARPHGDATLIADRLVAQLTHPVLWEDTLRYLDEQHADVFIDVGPGEVLKNMTGHVLPDATSFSLTPEDRSALERELATDITARRENPNLLGKCLAVAVCTKNHNWDNETYERGVVAPYEQIKRQYEQSKQAAQPPDEAQSREALRLLRQILETKQTPRSEIIERYDEILDVTHTREVLGDYVRELVQA
jgi:[acyl-carrier-protein] S-malonyltransferase